MTIISNSFSLACRLLLSKYTISTLQSIDSADNQHGYGCIWKFSRFTIELMRKLCYPVFVNAADSSATNLCYIALQSYAFLSR